MKKKLFELIRSKGYEPHYSGKTGILYCKNTTNEVSNEDLREAINDLVEECCETSDIFFNEIKFE